MFETVNLEDAVRIGSCKYDLLVLCGIGYLVITAVFLINEVVDKEPPLALTLLFFVVGAVCCLLEGIFLMICYSKCSYCTAKTLILGIFMLISGVLMAIDVFLVFRAKK